MEYEKEDGLREERKHMNVMNSKVPLIIAL